jgi:PAS domain S-box-containing protein
MFGAVPAGLAVLDHDARFVRVNRRFTELTAVLQDAATGRDVAEALGEPARSAVRHVLATGEPVEGIEFRTGTRRTLSASFVPLPGGRPAVGCLVTDVTRSRQLEQERDEAVTWLGLSNEAATVLGSSLEPATTLTHLCDLLVPSVADHVVIDLREEDGRLRRAAVRNAPDVTVDLALQRPVGLVTRFAAPHPIRQALETGQVVLYAEVADQPVSLLGSTDRRFVERTGIVSAAVVPMLVGGRATGTVTLMNSASDRRFGPHDVALAGLIVTRGAIALANAISYEQQRASALTLQRSLLPHSLPILESVETAWRYMPGTAGTEVGGDWLEVFELPGGRVVAVVGDVMGRGLRAAAVMGQLRTAVRTLALADPSPAEVLAGLDRVVAELVPGQLVTCVYCVYDPRTSVLTLANAGHVPPIVLGADRYELLAEALGLPLGVGGEGFKQVEVPMPVGSTVVLYTDGLVERRGDDLEDSIHQLAARVWSAPGTLEERCDVAVGPDLAGYDDDAAVLLLRVTAQRPGAAIRAALPRNPAAAARARRLTAEALAGWELDQAGTLLPTAQLLVSELVTNAVLHGSSEIEFQLRRGRDALWVEVGDRNPNPPQLRQARPDDEGGRGIALVQELAAAWGTRPTPAGKVVWLRLDLGPDLGPDLGVDPG